MRIDATNRLSEDQQPDRPGSTSGPKNDEALQATLGGDTASLSTTTQKVEALKASLQNAPEIRNDRVKELQTALQQGSYQVTDQQIAGAIFSQLLGPTLLPK
jgi:flagellar biosynthesis anti-sigma factor FlgM